MNMDDLKIMIEEFIEICEEQYGNARMERTVLDEFYKFLKKREKVCSDTNEAILKE